jgi:hypothetical protein
MKYFKGGKVMKFVQITVCALFALMSATIFQAQEIKIAGRDLQIHGFGTQGFIHTDGNNWLTMNTNGVGSGAFTDVGLNVGMQLRDNLRIGAQAYDRKLGQIGAWHPLLDWALVDYRVKPWLGFKGGKVKTVLGLFTDTQDMDFANTFALLPQSVYAIDLRDATIAHLGGDIYGRVKLPRHLGTVAYTAYGGHRSDSMHSAYPYLLNTFGIKLTSYGGPVFGGDFRWNTPLQGLTVGASRLNEEITGVGTSSMGAPGSTTTASESYKEYSKHDWTNQYYGQYTANRWHAESEYRRYLRDQMIRNGVAESITDIRGWYVSGGFRVCKWFETGSYFSNYRNVNPKGAGPDGKAPTDYAARDFDKVVTGKFTVNQYMTVKVEGHFMSGYSDQPYPNGYYTSVNSNGFVNDTKALVVRTGFSF